MKVSELNVDQMSHLIWRLAKYTDCGWVNAERLARSETALNGQLEDFFVWAGFSKRSVRNHVRRVTEFKVDPVKMATNRMCLHMMKTFEQQTHEMSVEQTLAAAKGIQKMFRTYIRVLKTM